MKPSFARMLYEQEAQYGPTWRGAVSGIGAMPPDHADLDDRDFALINVGAVPDEWRRLQLHLEAIEHVSRALNRHRRSLTASAARFERLIASINEDRARAGYAPFVPHPGYAGVGDSGITWEDGVDVAMDVR